MQLKRGSSCISDSSKNHLRLDARYLSDMIKTLSRVFGIEDFFQILPRRAMVEIVRRCNLHCPLCPVGNRKARQMPDMTWNTFRGLVDAFGPTLESITLHNYGEPLLHPQVAEFIRYAKASGVSHVDLSTNGNYMPGELVENLIASGLDTIRFSVDTSDPEVYKLYRKGGQLEQVLRNIERMAKKREFMETKTPRIEAQALLMRDNESKAKDFGKVLRKIGADSIRWKTFNVFMSGEEYGKMGKQFLPKNPGYRRYAGLNPTPAGTGDKIRLCQWPWNRLVVLTDGTITPCCHDFNGDFPLGKIEKGRAETMWNTLERVVFLFRRTLNPETIAMCRRCSSAVPSLSLRKDVLIKNSGESR